jgi:molybdopterin-synthase adenylyltransferase
LAALRICICGVGAVGSNLADNLARQGSASLRLIDHDRVEAHNISTQIFGEADVGAWKVEALRNCLFRACGIEAAAVRKKLDSNNAQKLLGECDLIVDALDNTAARQCVQEHARASGAPCLHVGLFEDYCEIIWDAQYRVPADGRAGRDVCDYALARNLVVLATAIASETIVRWACDGQRQSFSATLRDFAIAPIAPAATTA